MLERDTVRAKDRVEAVRAKTRELLVGEKQRDELKPDGLISVSNVEAQLGHPLLVSEVIRRLKIINRNLHFEVSNSDPKKMGIYVLENRPDETGALKLTKRFVCGMENGPMPEFSIQHSKPHRIPDPDVPGHWQTINVFAGETRGWRTVLARLLREGLITEPSIHRHFEPEGRDSERWQTLTRR